ncbi:MAG: UspA domain protein [Thermomicrobiales bacterium]|jgi:nucleotide-binding universal stress UspA family protein|nr:UspA domain protein [Thermomicrobiales bacterium]
MTSPSAAITPTLLAPLDGSPAAEAILPAIEVLATRMPAAVVLLHVIERRAPRHVHGERHLSNETEADAYLRDVAARLAARGIAATWHVHTVPVGDVPRSIAAHAAEHDAALITLSVHGTGDPRSWWSGAVAQAVIRHAHVPVLLVRAGEQRGGAPFAPQVVTVALDADRQGESALPAAARLARTLGTPLRLFMVVPTVATIPGDQAAAARLIPSGAAAALDVEAAAATDYLARLAARVPALAGEVPVVAEVARGDPAQAMTELTRQQPGILALATHGRAGLDALWSGSIGSRVIARASGPFLLVHPEPADAIPQAGR